MEISPTFDGCPYRRPFPDDFRGCPAYQPIRAFPIDTRHNALRPIWTCGHLEVGNVDRGRAYARCRLGDAASRARWASDFDIERVAEWRRIAADFGRVLEPYTRRLYELKDRQLGASSRESRAAASVALESAVDEFLELNRRLLDQHAADLAGVGFPADAVHTLTVAAMRSFLERATMNSAWTPPEDLMEPFPKATRDFLAGLFGGSTRS